MVRADQVRSIQADLDPSRGACDIAHVHVIVAYDRAGAGGSRNHHFITTDRNTVLDQCLRGAVIQGDVVTTTARHAPGTIMNVDTFKLHPEARLQLEPSAQPIRKLYILSPTKGTPIPLDAIIVGV